MIVKDVDMDESGNKTYVFGNDELLREAVDALKGIEPYLDAIVCYASTMKEHEPNRLAATVRAAIAKYEGKDEPLDSQ